MRFLDEIGERLDGIRADGLWKTERPIASPQGARGRRWTGARC